MSAVQTLIGNNATNFITNKYIEQVLQEGGESIFERQDTLEDSSIPNLQETLQARSYSVSNGTLSLSHLVQQRFFDIKPRKSKLPYIPLHNKLIWSEYNAIAGKVAYGFLETAKQTIAQKYNIDIHG